jgi:hypothetical protein
MVLVQTDPSDSEESLTDGFIGGVGRWSYYIHVRCDSQQENRTYAMVDKALSSLGAPARTCGLERNQRACEQLAESQL